MNAFLFYINSQIIYHIIIDDWRKYFTKIERLINDYNIVDKTQILIVCVLNLELFPVVLIWSCILINECCCRAANGLNGYEFEGGRLKAETVDTARAARRGRPGARGGPGTGSSRPTDFPLRLLVQSDMVGAIIGRQGSTIRFITQQSRARVDVHRKENVGSLEKAITIYGNPENCTNACKRILEVMQQEANNTNKGWA